LELRHLRYFVAVADEGSLTRAGVKLRVAQPALSRQMHQLERELGVPLFERSSRGVALTAAGRAFLGEARKALEHAELAAASARGASQGSAPLLRFAHGQLFVYGAVAEELLARFRAFHPEVRVAVTGQDDPATHDALLARSVDVGCVLSSEWPPVGFEGHRLLEVSITGVLLPASHPLSASAVVTLSEMQVLPWLVLSPQRWPGFHRVLEDALRARGLVPRVQGAGPAPSPFISIAAGEGWALTSEAAAAPYRGSSSAVVYRPFVEAAIPCWLSLVWAPPQTPAVARLVETASGLGLQVDRSGPHEASKLA
jgi:DNA-binding transcriptional LysR family regulator